jgi:hypothetical protein
VTTVPSGIERSSRKNALFRQIDGVGDLPCIASLTEEEVTIRPGIGVHEMVGDTSALERQLGNMRLALMRITIAHDFRTHLFMGRIIANAAPTPKPWTMKSNRMKHAY